MIEGLPAGARIEGYRDFVVQDLKVAAHNTRYRRTVYRLPDGTLQVAARPDQVSGHFGVGLKQFVLYQVHQMHVSQARLRELLRAAPCRRWTCSAWPTSRRYSACRTRT